MKVLWFTNTSCSASEYLLHDNMRGGWLSSLERPLSQFEEIKLFVAFYHSKKIQPFKYNNTQFYPIFRKNSGSKLQRFYSRLLNFNNDIKEVQELIRIAEEIRPDIIHVHGTEDNFGLIQYYLDVPVIISMQGIITPYLEKFYAGIPEEIIRKFTSLKSKILRKSAGYHYNSFKLKANRELEILKISQNILGRTDWDRRVSRILAPQSTYFIGQEMLRNFFYSNIWGKSAFNKKIRIITVSSESFYKGFETIVKSAKLLSAHCDFSFEWLVVGLSKNSEIVKIAESWLQINTEELNIQLVGEIQEVEVGNLILSSDIFCQVSHIENSPNSLCEAMMLGIPIIATCAGGTTSIFENGKDGLLIQAGDPYTLSGAIIEMSNDFVQAQKFSKLTQVKAKNRHNKTDILNDLITVYRSVQRKGHNIV